MARFDIPEHTAFHDALDLAISALRVQQETEKNEPLTIEELRDMEGIEEAAKAAFEKGLQIVTGSYAGTGTNTGSKELVFPFIPKLVVVGRTSQGLAAAVSVSGWQDSFLWYEGISSFQICYARTSPSSTTQTSQTFRANGTSLKWGKMNSTGEVIANYEGYEYIYLAIGENENENHQN